MKILFLSHYFPPEINAPASRTYEHCKVWAEQGHEVTVVTCVPNHPQGKIYPPYRNRLWQREERDGIQVIRLFTYATANEGFLRRTANYVLFLKMVALMVWRLPKADVVVSTSPQFFAGLAGYLVSRVKRVPWVLEVRDLWPDSILAVGAMKNRRLIAVLEALERFAYRKAARIVSVTDSFVPHIEARGGAGKTVVIKNGVNLDLFKPRPRDEAFARELGCEGRFVAAYVGTHGMAHGLDTLLEAAKLLQSDKRFRFVMVGGGAERARLLAKRDAMGLSNVVMLEQMAKEEMPRLWSICDASLVLLRDLPLFASVIPSKIFESMAMGVPILLGVRGESAEIVQAAGCGLAIPPENPAALAQALRDMADDPSELEAWRRVGQGYVREHFDRRVLAMRFLDLLAEMTGMPGGTTASDRHARLHDSRDAAA